MPFQTVNLKVSGFYFTEVFMENSMVSFEHRWLSPFLPLSIWINPEGSVLLVALPENDGDNK